MAIALRLLDGPKDGADPRKGAQKEKLPFLPENPPPLPFHRNVLPGADQRRILVVDDNPVVLKAFELKLKGAGFVVSTTPQADSVATIADTARVDLIILDINFNSPVGATIEWSGFAVMQWLKRFPELAPIPIIMISGSESAQYREKALAAGAAAFFQKPVKFSELIAVIQQTLGLGGSPEKT